MSEPKLAIDYHAAAGRAELPFVRRWLPRAAALVRTCRLRTLSVAIVGDATMSRLHEQFLGIPGPTDVLTFELETNAHGSPTVGEVVVCAPEARRQARAHGTRMEHELLLYALHGVLHLSGYDDLDPAAHRRMHLAEDRILTSLTIGAVFHRPKGARRPKKAARR